MPSNHPVKSVARAFAALDFITRRHLAGQTARLTDVAAEIGIAPAATRNILRTAVAAGWLARGPSRTYIPGPRAAWLSRAATIAGPFARSLAAAVSALAAETGESAAAFMLEDSALSPVAHAEGSEPVRTDPLAEIRLPFWASAAGRILAAGATDSEITALIAECGAPGDYWQGAKSRTALARLLDETRALGRAESETGEVAALAAPVKDKSGATLAAISICAPADRYISRRMELIDALLSATEKLSM